MISDADVKELEKKANDIRVDIIKMLLEAGSGHTGGPLGMTDIFTALYFHVLNIDPKKPDWIDRDRLILSNGHICPVMYATIAHRGFFPISELMTLRKLGSRLQGHPHRSALPGLETTSGPLGSGLSQSCGVALAGKLNKAKWRVYCLMSDGEQDEGNTWEAVMFAGKYKINNLVALIDRNNIQIDGFTEEIINAYEEAKTIFEKPTLILAHTIPGKGVDFMENKYEWHGKPPNKEEAEKALAQLK